MALMKPLDWRSCEYVSMANASRIAGRSPGWAQELVTFGALKAFRLPSGGPPVVTVESLAAFLDGAEPVPVLKRASGERPHLKVVT
ncbi:MAG: hypothetical protein VX874_17670 [Pseudomonadota bacterium]|nr:hypothetical protein [Pseudomonadota bacterium]